MGRIETARQRLARRRAAERPAQPDPDDAANAAERVPATDATQKGGSPMTKPRHPAGPSPYTSTTAWRDDPESALDGLDLLFDSDNPTDQPDDEFAREPGGTLRTGNGDGPGAWVPPSVAGAAVGSQAQWHWRAARDVRKTILRIRKRPLPGIPTDQWLREKAGETLKSRGPDGKSGALGQLRGHLFEHLDIDDYNRRGGAYRLKPVRNPLNPGYDAIRRDANGHFAGAVQHKSGPAGIGKAIKNLEARKPSSARKATIRVPKDQLQDCREAAGRRIRVQESHLTNKTVARRAEKGLRDLAAHGEAASSLSRQAGRAANKNAAISVAKGVVVDLPAVRRGDLNARQFVARRGVDAAEAWVSAACTTMTAVGVTAGATSLASAATAGTLAATVAGTVATSTVVAPAAAGIAIGYGVGQVARPLRRYVTDRLDSRADDERGPSGPDEPPEGSTSVADGSPRLPTRPKSGPAGAALEPEREPAVA